MKQKQKLKSKPFASSNTNIHKKSSEEKKRRYILGLIIGVFGFLLYSNTLSNGYVLDDFSAVKENNIVRQGIHAIPEIFKTSYRQGYLSIKDGLYRPLSLVTYAIEWNYFPDKPSVAHFTNMMIYGLTGFLLFLMLCKLFASPQPSPKEREQSGSAEVIPFIASLLFIAHPLHAEVVANIKSRDEMLCFLFIISSFLFVFRFSETGNKKFLWSGLLTYFLSLLSKETSITFLALLPLALHFFASLSIKKNAFITALFLIPAAVYLLMRHSVLQGANVSEGTSMADNVIVGAHSISTHLGTAFFVLGQYLKLLVFPHPLSYDYSMNHIEVVSIGNIVSLASLVVYSSAGIYASYILYQTLKQKSQYSIPIAIGINTHILSFGILFFLITIFLFSNLILIIGTSMGDRLMYFPSLGFCICVAVLFNPHPKGSNDIRSFALQGRGVLLFIIVSFFAYKTYSRNFDWKNNYTLYGHDVNVVPKSVKAHYYLGLELVKVVAVEEQDAAKKKELYEEGIAELQKAVAILPSFSSAYTQMGVAYYRLKNYEKAIEHYKKALEFRAGDAITLNNIGTVYFEWGKYNEAKKMFEEAIAIDPRFIDAHMNLGSVYGTLRDYNNAIGSFQNAIRYAPDNARAYYFIGMTYKNMGDAANAANYFQMAQRLDPALVPPPAQ